jgi:hypothetical protein
MVGASSSGKSTFASKLAKIENSFVASGEKIKAELYGEKANPGNWVEIHDRIEELVSEACGMPVILDRTHYLYSHRIFSC